MGIIGSLLGIINLIISHDKVRIKLKVFPTVISFLKKKDGLLTNTIGIEVRNLSNFSITIRDVGFLSKKFKNSRLDFFDKRIVEGGKLPRRMEPRTAIRIYHPNPHLFSDIKEIKGAYAVTECGREIRGKCKRIRERDRTRDELC